MVIGDKKQNILEIGGSKADEEEEFDEEAG